MRVSLNAATVNRMPMNPSTPSARHHPAGADLSALPAALAALMLAATLAGCAAQPVVYGGGGVAQADIDDCKRLARAAGAGAQGGQVARDTALGAAAGGAASGAWSAVRGDSDVGNRAAAGAAAGAAVGLVRGVARGSEPSGAFKAYVNRCLSERGYDVVGWN
jgi:outer membrane lipoprotein SlyB